MTAPRSRLRPNQPAGRRPGVSPGRRFALALGLTLVLLGSAGAASADSGSAPMVSATVYASGGGTSATSVSASQLLADPQNCPAYSQTEMTEYDSSGPTSVGLPHENGSGTGTWPMSTVLHCLQQPVSVGDVTGITVFNSDGSPEVASGSQLTPADLANPSDFQPNTDSPVVSDLGSSFQYNRPWRGQGDLNANDQVTSSDPISIEVFEGPPLTVNTSASPSSPAAGTGVSFSATVTGDENSALTYNWSFGDNLPDSHEPSPSVTYTDAGNYTVTLQVTDTNGGAGGTTVPITVSGPSNTAPPSTTSTPATSTGPNGAGNNPNGGARGSAGGNGKGSGTTPSNGNGTNGTPSQPTSSHTQQPSHSGGVGASGASGSPSVKTSSSTTTSRATTTPSSSSSSPPATHAFRHRRSTQRAPTHTRPSPTDGSPGQLVTGRLVADVTPLPASASPLVRESPGSAAAAPAPPTHTARSPAPVVAGCLAVVVLLGLGAGRELRGPGWWRTPRSSN
ncbi:MAG TPA: PKD domain-containing protein [Solirubrobacteraceae bacterium]|nr:PKD domain-containing protein [Solirubrobacteraceae bacterium]